MKTILLLDDNELLLGATSRALRLALDPAEWQIVTRSRPTQAIMDINSQPAPFDVVITDFMMPGIFGDQVAYAARRRDNATLCIIYSDTPKDAETANDALPEAYRAHHVVSKSDGVRRLVELVTAWAVARTPPATT